MWSEFGYLFHAWYLALTFRTVLIMGATSDLDTLFATFFIFKAFVKFWPEILSASDV